MRLDRTAASRQPCHRIPIVEDDPDLTGILQEYLGEEGFEFKCLPGSTDIVPVLESFKPDLVLLDYLLPLINGGELCSQIKSREESRALPVVIYSAFPRVLMSMGNYGCDRFLEKPFDLKELLRHIQELLAHRSALNGQ